MKKRLRLLAWLITLTILCQMLPFSAFAQSDIAQTLVQRRVSASSLDEQNDLSSVTFEGGTGTPEDPYQSPLRNSWMRFATIWVPAMFWLMILI